MANVGFQFGPARAGTRGSAPNPGVYKAWLASKSMLTIASIQIVKKGYPRDGLEPRMAASDIAIGE
jgi:hypothetical protein